MLLYNRTLRHGLVLTRPLSRPRRLQRYGQQDSLDIVAVALCLIDEEATPLATNIGVVQVDVPIGLHQVNELLLPHTVEVCLVLVAVIPSDCVLGW